MSPAPPSSSQHLKRLPWNPGWDAYGVDLQVWVYTHLLPDRELTLHAWGVSDPRIPWWQRTALKLVFPVATLVIRKAFQLTPANYQKSRQRIGELLTDMEQRIGPEGGYLMGGNEPSFVDFAFCGPVQHLAVAGGFRPG